MYLDLPEVGVPALLVVGDHRDLHHERPHQPVAEVLHRLLPVLHLLVDAVVEGGVLLVAVVVLLVQSEEL